MKAILEQNVMDDHWRSASSSCSLCNGHNFTYDYILRYENLAEEEPYLISSLKLNRALKSRHEHGSRDPIDDERKRSYFKVFNEREMAALYEFYRSDFELFQYDMSDFRQFIS